MKYEGTLLVSKNVRKSVDFYTKLLSCSIILDLETYVTFERFCIMDEEGWLAFNPGIKALQYGGNVAQLGFETEDIDAFVELLKSFPDVPILTPLLEAPWGQRSIHILDPDKHIVEIGEDMKVVTKRYLKQGMTVDETQAKVMYPREFVEMCSKELGM